MLSAITTFNKLKCSRDRTSCGVNNRKVSTAHAAVVPYAYLSSNRGPRLIFGILKVLTQLQGASAARMTHLHGSPRLQCGMRMSNSRRNRVSELLLSIRRGRRVRCLDTSTRHVYSARPNIINNWRCLGASSRPVREAEKTGGETGGRSIECLPSAHRHPHWHCIRMGAARPGAP